MRVLLKREQRKKKKGQWRGQHLPEKSDLWAAVVTVGYDAETGKIVRKYVYGKTKQEAQEKKAALLEQVKGGVAYIDADKVTVGQWLEKWLETYARPKVRQKTFDSYEYLTRNYILPALGNQKLLKLQVNQIQTMLNEITTAGKLKSRRT